MFYDEIDNPKPLSKRGVKACVWTVVVCSIYIAALAMTADKPAHKSDCVGDTLTCSQEVGE